MSGQGGSDTGRSQHCQSQTHVTVRQSLCDQCVGGDVLAGSDALESFRDVDHGDAQLRSLSDEVLRRSCLVVGLVSSLAQARLSEFLNRLDDHLLILGRGEVEELLCLLLCCGLLCSLGFLCRTLRLTGTGNFLKLTVRGTKGLKTGLGGLVHHAVDLWLKVVLLGEVRTSNRRDEPHCRSDSVATRVIAADSRIFAVLLLAHVIMAFRVRTITGITIKQSRDRCHKN